MRFIPAVIVRIRPTFSYPSSGIFSGGSASETSEFSTGEAAPIRQFTGKIGRLLQFFTAAP
jgi:hypothetical protein